MSLIDVKCVRRSDGALMWQSLLNDQSVCLPLPFFRGVDLYDESLYEWTQTPAESRG